MSLLSSIIAAFCTYASTTLFLNGSDAAPVVMAVTVLNVLAAIKTMLEEARK